MAKVSARKPSDSKSKPKPRRGTKSAGQGGSRTSPKVMKPTRELKPSRKLAGGSAVAKAITGGLPPRSSVKVADTWDLSPLFSSTPKWEAEYIKASDAIPGYERFKGRFGESASVLREFFVFDAELSRVFDRLGVFASLRASEDQGSSEAQRLRQKYQHLATKASEASSYYRPELMALPQATLDAYMVAPELSDWRLAIERTARYRPHTLSPSEEKLLAMQGQMSDAAAQIFRQLNDADLKFGTIKNDKGKSVEIAHGTFGSLMQSSNRDVRKTAFNQYYAGFDGHRNSIAAALSGSVQRDIYYARVRNFTSAREASLFADNVPTAVYDNLVGSVRANLSANHKYLEIRRRAMKLRDIHQYDTYLPILSDLKKRHSWDQAVKAVCESLSPLGNEYVTTLQKGLTSERWCDRYPNQGKQSGAFSSGTYDAPPYILMNFKEDVLDDVFTLTHEAGHSMHSWYSVRNQPYQYSDYVIFVAEVASTFNEQLLARHMMDQASNKRERAYLVNRLIDSIRSTVIRQTMFAEFERDIHAMAENGEPLTVESLRATYRKLLEAYFGPKFSLDPNLDLECLRIPHFYRAFYVYKYATGLCASIALSQRVLNGVAGALPAYLSFLKGGGSKFPLDLLKDAGVDITTPAPVDAALKHFGELVEELDGLL